MRTVETTRGKNQIEKEEDLSSRRQFHMVSSPNTLKMEGKNMEGKARQGRLKTSAGDLSFGGVKKRVDITAKKTPVRRKVTEKAEHSNTLQRGKRG